MSGFALLWGKILDSSIWVKESKETRLVWITLMAMKDKDGIVQASVIGLADRAKVSLQECREALRIFLSPDPDDTSKVEGGRRVREIPGGWQLINHDLYRFSTAARRELWKMEKAEQRAKQARQAKPKRKPKLSDGNPAGEDAYVRAAGAGASDAQLDRIVGESLPADPEPPQILNP